MARHVDTCIACNGPNYPPHSERDCTRQTLARLRAEVERLTRALRDLLNAEEWDGSEPVMVAARAALAAAEAAGIR